MFKGDGKLRFTVHPSIRNHFNKVLWRHGLMKRYGKAKLMIVMGCLFSQNKLLNMEDSLMIAVVHKNIKWLCRAMDLRVPLEICIHFQFQFNSQQSPRNWLDISFKLYSGKLVDMSLNCFTQLLISNDFSELLCCQFIKMMELKLNFSLKFFRDFIKIGHLRELSEWRHRVPKAFLAYFTHIQQLVS